MAIQEMIKDLELHAREEGEKILANARVQTKEIIKEAEEKGKKLAAESLNKANLKLEVEKAKVLSSANFFVKKELIKAKERIIGELFSRLEERLKKDLNTGSEAIFAKLANEALSQFKDQKITVLVNKDDKLLAQNVMDKMGVKYKLKDSLNSIGGLKVQSEDGRITVDNTIDSRLQKARNIYEPRIIAQLFGDEQ